MAALQFAIGALNDIIDAPADAGRVRKPIPSGRSPWSLPEASWSPPSSSVSLSARRRVLRSLHSRSSSSGSAWPMTSGRRAPWSWLPFAVGIPLLPVYGWVGATGSPPGFFAVLVPMAVLAGAALAIANARVDLDADRASGTRSVATALGAERSWWLGAFLMAGATLLGVLFVGRSGWTWPVLALVAGGTAVVGTGLAIGRGGDPLRGAVPGRPRRSAPPSRRRAGSRGCSPDLSRQSKPSPERTRAMAFSRRSFEIVRYLARLSRSTSGIERMASGARNTLTSSSRASASDALALTSESSLSGRRERSASSGSAGSAGSGSGSLASSRNASMGVSCGSRS